MSVETIPEYAILKQKFATTHMAVTCAIANLDMKTQHLATAQVRFIVYSLVYEYSGFENIVTVAYLMRLQLIKRYEFICELCT